MGGSNKSQHQVRIYSKHECPLCDQVKEILHRCAKQRSLLINEIDISEDPVLIREYGDRIPVVIIDGTELSRNLLQEHKLLKILAK